MQSEKQLDNLKKRNVYKPGNKHAVGHGRPRKYKSLEVLIQSVVSDSDWEKIIKAVKQKAMKGDKHSADLLLDRLYGRPLQTVAINETPVINITHSVITLDEAKKLNAETEVDLKE